jgi:hypothetical protein
MKAMRNLFIGGRDALAFYRARRDGIFASRVDRENARALLETAKMREVIDYDLCGTRRATVIAVKPDAKGWFSVELPREDDVRLRPAWIVVRYGRDFNNGGTRWIWPKRPEFHEPRLIQSRLTGDNFSRIEIAEKYMGRGL